MKIPERIKRILKILYNTGHIYDEHLNSALNESAIERIRRKMKQEEEANDEKIHEVKINNLLLKNDIRQQDDESDDYIL